MYIICFFFSSRRRHTIYIGDWSSDVCSSDLAVQPSMLKAVSELLLLDDGFQHRRLHRDLDIVLIDATAPWRSEERRVGKVCRAQWAQCTEDKQDISTSDAQMLICNDEYIFKS